MPPYFNQLTQYDGRPAAEGDAYSGIRQIAKESDYFDPGNVLFGLAGGVPMAVGSAAKFRTPLRASVAPWQTFGNGEKPDQYEANYHLRNRLGEPPFKAKASFALDAKSKIAYLLNLGIDKLGPATRLKPGGHSGARPDQFNDIVGRVAEELQGAGFNSVTTAPTSAGRTRLYDRAFRQLSHDPRLAPGMTLDMPPKEDFLRSDYTKAVESPGMRGVINRRQEKAQPNTGHLSTAQILQEGGVNPAIPPIRRDPFTGFSY